MADPIPVQQDRCDDQNHRRLLILGVVLIIAFCYVITLVWIRELKISDAVFSQIIQVFVASISAIVTALAMTRQRSQSQQEKPNP